MAWVQLSQKLVKQGVGFSPPVAARAYAYIGVTLYESVVLGMAGYQSLAGQLNGFADLPKPSAGVILHWPTVANAALATSVRHLFARSSPRDLAAMNSLEAQFADGFAEEVPAAVFADSVAFGKAIAEAIFTISKSDGGHEGYKRNQPKTYAPPVGDGLWVPTPRHFYRALQPTWGQNRPFAMAAGEVCGAPPPLPFSTVSGSPFHKAAREVYDTVKQLTPEQREIALYWEDAPVFTSTPAGHSLTIATQLLQQEDASLARAALVYAQVGMAVNDAFISVWHSKYKYNLLRPITYIQRYIDSTWNTPEIKDPVVTPPFPSYPSGHAGEASAAMTVLSALYGDVYPFTDRTHIDRGMAPRSYRSLWQAAEESALSRLYGGIHFRFDNDAGLQQGKCVAKKVEALKFKK